MRLPHPFLLLAAASAVTASAVTAQEAAPRPITVMDTFRVDYFAGKGNEPSPVGWFDPQSVVMFASGPRGVDQFLIKDVTDGGMMALFDRARFVEAVAALEGMDVGDGEALASDESAFTWRDDYSTALVEADNDLFVFDREAGTVVRLTDDDTEEQEPHFSPDGAMVSFVKDHNLFVVSSAGGEPVQLTTAGNQDLFYGLLDWVYQEEVYGRGDFQGHWWSPDGSQLALLELDESPVEEMVFVRDVPQRPEVERLHYPKAGEPNPKVRLGAIPGTGGGITWFDLSEYAEIEFLVVRVTWSPGGDMVFFQVTNREQTWLDMLAGNPADGSVARIFREESDCWVEPGPVPHFLDDGSFLWLSERSGRKHLYRQPAAAAGAEQMPALEPITEGEWNVHEVVEVDPAGTAWVLTDRHRAVGRQLERIDLGSGELTRITEEPGTHEVKLSPDRSRILDEFSSVAIPRRVQVLDGAGEKVTTLVDSEVRILQMFGIQPPEWIEIPTRDGFVLEGYWFKPRGYQEGQRYPTIQFNYSGPHLPVCQDRWGGQRQVFHHMLAQAGYAVFQVDPRSASGKGRFAHKTAYKQLGKQECADLEDAANWMVEQGIADPERIAIWGWSYGGYQTLYCLTHSKVWTAGVAVNPVTSWFLYDTIYTERYMGLPQDNRAAYEIASVVDDAANLHGNLLLVHATMDDNVHLQNSHQLIHALQMAGKQFRYMAYPRVRHGIESLEQQVHLHDMMQGFFAEHLR